jgi:2-hydroxychromene-2-carboxylate isomerase
MANVEFFFDYTCPYAYLASTQIESLCERTKSSLVWRPMLLGGLFRSLGVATNLAATMGTSKAKMLLDDQRRWADLWGVEIKVPRADGYARSVDALRATIAADEADRAMIIHALYRAYWVEHEDIGDRARLEAVLDRAGVSGKALLARIDDGVKQRLRDNTDEAVRRGAFGAPSIFVGDALFFGQDRLAQLEEALGGAPTQPGEGRFSVTEDHRPTSVELFYDVASPFSYLGAEAIVRMCERRRCAVSWRPILLGGLFKELGGALVPFATYPKNKQRFLLEDLERAARHWGVSFRWNSRFPVRSLKAQRVAVALSDVYGERSTELSRYALASARAVWAQDCDPDENPTIVKCLEEAGVDPALARRADEPDIKQALVARTREAMERGVFGVPTFSVNGALFWGQDRVCLVERALEGWIPPDRRA